MFLIIGHGLVSFSVLLDRKKLKKTEMKLSAALFACATAEWTQPKYYDFIHIDPSKVFLLVGFWNLLSFRHEEGFLTGVHRLLE